MPLTLRDTTQPSVTAVPHRARPAAIAPTTVFSFDIEEHHRIEAATHLTVPLARQNEYVERAEATTNWILDLLEERRVRATFFIVGALAEAKPRLVRRIHDSGHEVASHSWSHRRVLAMTPDEFRDDLRHSVDFLQQMIGAKVHGFRAPTFSITRANPWAIDILAEEGLTYDSSIFPVLHDRYGVRDAPSSPFRVHGIRHALLELPPLTLSIGGHRLPVGGGGYFRLFPLSLIKHGLMRNRTSISPPVAMLYFHPWEFDPGQPKLSLSRLAHWRTYAGIRGARSKLAQLLDFAGTTARAIDVVRALNEPDTRLSEYRLGIQQPLLD